MRIVLDANIYKTARTGIVENLLSKEETKQCGMWGQLVEAKMDDTGKLEEFTYGYELIED